MPQPPTNFTLRGTERANSRPKARPRPPGTPHGDWLGDQRIFTDDLVDNKKKPVGHHSGHATLVRIGPGDLRTYQATATFFFNVPELDGTIVAIAVFSLPTSPQPLRAAVVGGTGAFWKAAGHIELSFPAPDVTVFKFQL
jgi:hypothetical protein